MAEGRTRSAASLAEDLGDTHRPVIGDKALLDGSLDRDVVRERERDAALARLIGELPSRSKTP